MSTDAARGSDAPFDPRIHALRGHRGQIEVAAALRALMAGSAIRASHLTGDERVQDPYCLRCQPQVMGAVLDLLRQAAATLATEANGVSDNPLIFAETGEALSGGNFHAEPVAFAADMLALAVCEIGSLAERRIAMLVDPALSGLPAFLTPRPGLNSGFMIAQVTAAALVAENKQRAHPASVDSIPTSANQEDHVSMAAHGARRLAAMAENAATSSRIELLAAAQGCDFHAPLASSAPLERCARCCASACRISSDDRYLAPDIAAAADLVRIRRALIDAAAGADICPRSIAEGALRMTTRLDNARIIRAPRGTQLTAKSWLTEAPLRMLMNNLDPEVAEKPARARGLWRHRPRRARLGELRPHRRGADARSRPTRRCACSRASRSACSAPIADAPRVLIANSNLVPHWATWSISTSSIARA